MLAVSPFSHDENKGKMESFSIISSEEFPDFAEGNLLESIDFDDLFIGMDEGDMLPDLEMVAELPVNVEEYSGMNNSDCNKRKYEEEDKVSGLDSGSGSSSSKDEENPNVINKTASSSKYGAKRRKSSSQQQAKNNKQEKRKVKKVDWTPELHKRFVQAVEQLGVDKAVPSRILELMGIDCLTRHNIASHLQKYRSHRKHLLAREAEAASWTHRRQMYGAATQTSGGGKRDLNPWVAPTMGFPPMSTMHHQHPQPQHHHHQFRPLHVWGHPTMDQSIMQLWPKHPSPLPPPTPQSAWGPPPADPSFWHHHHHHHQRVSNGVTPGTPCFQQPMAPTRFGAAPAPVPGIPPHHHGTGGQSRPHPLIDFHPSKESIDAAIGDVLSKPGMPLPLGLKPPSTDSVLGELQRQGVPNIPPSCA